MSYSDEIKSRLTAREVFEFYGFEVKRGGFVCCPLHGEKTPSLKVYDGTRGWHCFGCGKGGDVLDFVREYFNLSLPAACEKINADFNLGMSIGKPLSHQEQMEAQRAAAERKRRIAERQKRAEAVHNAYDAALTEYVTLDTVVRECAPESPETPVSDEYAFALRNIDGAAYRLAEAEANLYRFRKESY